MTKDPYEATITKRLAWLVEKLVVSSHEFSFILFYKLISKPFYQLCFIYFLFSNPLSKSLHLSCLYFTDFATTSLLFSHRCFIVFFTYHFWISFLFLFLFFFSFFNKEELVNNRREHKLLMLLSPLILQDLTC